VSRRRGVGGAGGWIGRLAAVLVLGGGCASGGLPARAPGAPAARAMAALVDGDTRAAEAVLAGPARDPEVLFLRAALAWERGDEARALQATLTLLEAAGRAGPRDRWTALLATGAAVRLPELLASAADPRPHEDRLLALTAAGSPLVRVLPWQARLALEEALDGIGRRRGDAALLDQLPARTGCLVDARLVGSVGRLPHLDLLAPLPAGGAGQPQRALEASGCRLSVPAREAVPGVRVLQARLPAGASSRRLVLDFVGPAVVRTGDGVWRSHAVGDRFGPRATEFAAPLGAGAGPIEVRIGSWGGPTGLRLFVLEPGPDLGPALAGEEGGDPARALIATLARALVADAVGDADRALEAADRLRGQRRFALGLAVAAALTASDPSKPSALAQDQAQALYRRAVAIDPGLARPFLQLGRAELARDQAPEAVDLAEQARKAAPGWWPAAALSIEALRARGFDQHADQVLDEALASLTRAGGEGGCRILQLALDRAQSRNRVQDEAALVPRVLRCDAQSSVELERLRRRGDLPAALAAAERQLRFTGDRTGLRSDLAALRLGLGDAAGAARLLRASLDGAPADAGLRVRLADAWLAAGRPADARRLLADTVQRFPGRETIRQVATLTGLPLPLDRFRRPGREVIAEYQRGKREYAAPAVLVLDRTVLRVLPDGTQAILTHNIVNVKTKDGIARWGEVQIPESAEILGLRTHKADGSVREAEEIVGKSSISAPELDAGDFVEWETVEYREPAEGFSPGFLSDRFFFQSVELPLHLSEFVVVVPEGLAVDVDRRAGAPEAETGPGPEPGTRQLRFVARQMPQLFAERAAVPHTEWIPSVRLSSGLGVKGWARVVAERLIGVARSSPALRAVAAQIAASAREQRPAGPAVGSALGPAILAWVTEHIEAEGGVSEPATATLARRRGSRAPLVVALARALGIPAELALARSPMTAPPTAPLDAQELDDFGDLLVRFPDASAPGGARYVDPRWRHAPFGYLPPALDGAVVLRLPGGQREQARSAFPDRRAVTLELRLAADGSGQGTVIERLRGWPAVEWAEAKKRVGEDLPRLRQDFEQRWLGHHFPGARLGGLAIDVDPARPGEATLRYSFTSAQLAGPSGQALELVPSFFQLQPGHRFATERRRRTGLVVGVDVPLTLSARLILPPGARVLETGGEGDVRAGPGGAIRLTERRRALPPAAGGSAEIRIEREGRLPLVRVAPADYEQVAARLRQMDRLEEAEIRFAAPAPPPAGAVR
jgi:tetratricopeptide (TPR) repeat protein